MPNTNMSHISFATWLYEAGIDKTQRSSSFQQAVFSIPLKVDDFKYSQITVDGRIDPNIVDMGIQGHVTAFIPNEGQWLCKGGFVFGDGKFWVQKINDKTVVHIQAHNDRLNQIAGDPDDEDNYTALWPMIRPFHIVLSGHVGSSETPSSIDDNSMKSFELKSIVYTGEKNEPTREFSLRCMFPATNRWALTNVPARNTSVTVSGEIIGLHRTTRDLAIMLDDIAFNPRSYSSSNADNASSPTAAATLGTVDSPMTPNKRKAWGTGGLTPGSKRARTSRGAGGSTLQAHRASPTPGSDSTVDTGVAGEETNIVSSQAQGRRRSQQSKRG